MQQIDALGYKWTLEAPEPDQAELTQAVLQEKILALINRKFYRPGPYAVAMRLSSLYVEIMSCVTELASPGGESMQNYLLDLALEPELFFQLCLQALKDGKQPELQDLYLAANSLLKKPAA